MYAVTTSTSSLRKHLRQIHYGLYIDTLKLNGWTQWLQPNEIDLQLQQQQAAKPSHQRLPFSPKALLDALVRWIVVDDQVRILVISISQI